MIIFQKAIPKYQTNLWPKIADKIYDGLALECKLIRYPTFVI